MNEEIKASIKEMWNNGLSGSEIANRLSITRNSVLGAVNRMKASGVEISTHVKTRSAKKKEPDPVIEIIFAPVNDVIQKKIFVEPNSSCSILRLKQDSCRYIVSAEGAKSTRYCGKQISKSSYCDDHYRICYTPHHKRH